MDTLKTDLYQITMLAAQYKKGLHRKVVTCEAFARKMPKARRYLVMAGTEEIKNYLCGLRFSPDDISYLKSLPILKPIFYSSNFEEYLKDFRFTGDLWAMAEGEVVFAGEPLIRITAPLPQAHMAETFALSVLNHDMRVASKAARIVLAAQGKPVLEFATRRTHHEAAVSAARAAYLAGFTASSNVEAGKRYGIPITGTMAHMWVMTHDSEVEAFKNFKDVYSSPILLIDTYDTVNGAKEAAKISGLSAVRLDSGDLDSLSCEVRKVLDDAGKRDVRIAISGDLDEYKIHEFRRSGAPIDVFAVGTELVVSRDAPSLGIVYKVVYDDDKDRPVVKVSPGKTTLPGRKQVFLDTRNGGWSHLVAEETAIQANDDLSPLLDRHIEGGNPTEATVDLETARRYCNGCLANLHASLAGLDPSDEAAPVYPHESLRELFRKAVG